jgi:hypothetical protein
MFDTLAQPPIPFGLSLSKPRQGVLVLPIILSLSKDGLRMRGHFDKLSPFGRLRMHGHFDKLSANGSCRCREIRNA